LCFVNPNLKAPLQPACAADFPEFMCWFFRWGCRPCRQWSGVILEFQLSPNLNLPRPLDPSGSSTGPTQETRVPPVGPCAKPYPEKIHRKRGSPLWAFVSQVFVNIALRWTGVLARFVLPRPPHVPPLRSGPLAILPLRPLIPARCSRCNSPLNLFRTKARNLPPADDSGMTHGKRMKKRGWALKAPAPPNRGVYSPLYLFPALWPVFPAFPRRPSHSPPMSFGPGRHEFALNAPPGKVTGAIKKAKPVWVNARRCSRNLARPPLITWNG